MKFYHIVLCFTCIIILNSCKKKGIDETPNYLIPFSKVTTKNPVLVINEKTSFYCPVRKDSVFWEEKDVFNPASVVKGDTLFLLYRAEDSIGKFKGTSRVGLAYSLDGYHFEREPVPVLYPDNDEFVNYEWEGGCEDPRVVEDENGIYYMTYTAYDGKVARLFIATSKDLRKWEKHGSVFKESGKEYAEMWSKSGSIISKQIDGRMVAIKIKGKYWMYWGESNIYMATSDNLIDWEPVLEEDENKKELDAMRNYKTAFKILFSTRSGKFDSALVEPGPPAIINNDEIIFIYNSKNNTSIGDKTLAQGTYAAGQVIIGINDPTQVLHRTDKWFITPDQPYEITGQVNNVCFVEGLAYFKNKWMLYYGTADSKIAVAESTKKIQ